MSNRSKRILIATGGTGGHVFPAQALAKQLQEKEYEVLFMGKGLSANKYFHRNLFSSVSIDSATPFQKNVLQKLLSFLFLGKGVWQAFREIRKYNPSLVVGFGSFHTFPVLAAAFLRRIPIVLFESNSVPGKVNKLFSRHAQFCGIQFPKAKEMLKGTCYEVEMPFWEEKKGQKMNREDSLRYFSLETGFFTVLVFGGSQGASFINPIVAETLKQFHQASKPVQVIHMTGSESSAEVIGSFYQDIGIKARVKSFEGNMHLAWSSADMVICRSGAATLAELMEFEVPAILIPYPTSADQHQLKNALFLEEEVRGGLCLEEKLLTPEQLLLLLKSCNIQEMKDSIRDFKQKKQKKQLIDHIEELLIGEKI